MAYVADINRRLIDFMQQILKDLHIHQVLLVVSTWVAIELYNFGIVNFKSGWAGVYVIERPVATAGEYCFFPSDKKCFGGSSIIIILSNNNWTRSLLLGDNKSIQFILVGVVTA